MLARKSAGLVKQQAFIRGTEGMIKNRLNINLTEIIDFDIFFWNWVYRRRYSLIPSSNVFQTVGLLKKFLFLVADTL